MRACMCICACGHGYINVSALLLCPSLWACVCQQEAIQWKWKESYAQLGCRLSRPILYVHRKKQCCLPCANWADREHIFKTWSCYKYPKAQVVSVCHSPPFKMYFKSPSGEINSPCAVLHSRRELYSCAYCSLWSASSIIKCYFSLSFTWARTMDNLLRQEKGSIPHHLGRTAWHHW